MAWVIWLCLIKLVMMDNLKMDSSVGWVSWSSQMVQSNYSHVILTLPNIILILDLNMEKALTTVKKFFYLNQKTQFPKNYF